MKRTEAQLHQKTRERQKARGKQDSTQQPASQDQSQPTGDQSQFMGDQGLTPKDFLKIPWQAIKSKQPTRQKYLWQQYQKSLGNEPASQDSGMFGYKNWLRKLLSSKEF